MNNQALRPYFLLALLTLSLVVAYYIFSPFLIPLALAMVFAVVLQPLYQKILSYVRHPAIAAGIAMLVCVLGILVPIAFLGTLILQESRQLYTSLSYGAGQTYLYTAAQHVEVTIHTYFPNAQLPDVYTSVDTYTKQSLAWLSGHLGAIFSSVASLFVGLFIFMFALYYLLRDGPAFKKALIELSPLDDDDDEVIFSRLELAVSSVIRGNLTIALIQGVLTAIGFTLFGVPNAILWGVVASITSLIPGVGTSLVIMPGALFMFLTGNTVQSIGLVLWGIIAVGTIDNVLGPRLIGKGMQLHPLIVMLAVLGGLSMFGPAGVFLGPLCISLLFAILAIHARLSKKNT